MRHAYIVGLSLAATLIAAIAGSTSAWGFDGPITEYPIPTGESNPSAIAPGPDGAMWFTEAAGDKIGRIDSTGKITEYPIPTANAQPNGIVTGSDGNIWFSETHADKIGKLVPSTGAIAEYALPTANAEPMRGNNTKKSRTQYEHSVTELFMTYRSVLSWLERFTSFRAPKRLATMAIQQQ